MAQALVVYSTWHGQSERIARRISETLVAAGHEVKLRAVETPGLDAAIGEADAVILGGSIHRGLHTRALERLARVNAAALNARHNAFFSVSLSAAGTPDQVDAARRCVQKFEARTGWRPHTTAVFAGALRYSRYGLLLRLVMRLIVTLAHGDTDPSRDYEYTDWQAVERFALDFAGRLATPAAA